MRQFLQFLVLMLFGARSYGGDMVDEVVEGEKEMDTFHEYVSTHDVVDNTMEHMCATYLPASRKLDADQMLDLKKEYLEFIMMPEAFQKEILSGFPTKLKHLPVLLKEATKAMKKEFAALNAREKEFFEGILNYLMYMLRKGSQLRVLRLFKADYAKRRLSKAQIAAEIEDRWQVLSEKWHERGYTEEIEQLADAHRERMAKEKKEAEKAKREEKKKAAAPPTVKFTELKIDNVDELKKVLGQYEGGEEQVEKLMDDMNFNNMITEYDNLVIAAEQKQTRKTKAGGPKRLEPLTSGILDAYMGSLVHDLINGDREHDEMEGMASPFDLAEGMVDHLTQKYLARQLPPGQIVALKQEFHFFLGMGYDLQKDMLHGSWLRKSLRRVNALLKELKKIMTRQYAELSDEEKKMIKPDNYVHFGVWSQTALAVKRKHKADYAKRGLTTPAQIQKDMDAREARLYKGWKASGRIDFVEVFDDEIPIVGRPFFDILSIKDEAEELGDTVFEYVGRLEAIPGTIAQLTAHYTPWTPYSRADLLRLQAQLAKAEKSGIALVEVLIDDDNEYPQLREFVREWRDAAVNEFDALEDRERKEIDNLEAYMNLLRRDLVRLQLHKANKRNFLRRQLSPLQIKQELKKRDDAIAASWKKIAPKEEL